VSLLKEQCLCREVVTGTSNDKIGSSLSDRVNINLCPSHRSDVHSRSFAILIDHYQTVPPGWHQRKLSSIGERARRDERFSNVDSGVKLG
jgi:hypothetical protein